MALSRMYTGQQNRLQFLNVWFLGLNLEVRSEKTSSGVLYSSAFCGVLFQLSTVCLNAKVHSSMFMASGYLVCAFRSAVLVALAM
eukprot:15356620-Ditylum_brightwellii.AAC.1